MSRKPHQIAQNDVRYSALPEQDAPGAPGKQGSDAARVDLWRQRYRLTRLRSDSTGQGAKVWARTMSAF